LATAGAGTAAGGDAAIKIWEIPEGGLTESTSTTRG